MISIKKFVTVAFFVMLLNFLVLPVANAGTLNIPDGFTFTKNLYFGMRNSDVVQLKAILTAEGCFTGLANNNYFGVATKAGVICFQNKYKDQISEIAGYTIKATGLVGAATREDLNAYISEQQGGNGNEGDTNCTPKWTCGWGPCTNGGQSQTIIDANNCGIPFGTNDYLGMVCPNMQQKCDSSAQLTISSVYPSSASAGAVVTVYGTNFTFTNTGAGTGVWIGDQYIVPSSVQSTYLTFIVPSSIKAGTYNLSVRGSAGNSGVLSFTITTTCTPNWSCGWGKCENGGQSWVAIDSNNCGTTTGQIPCPSMQQKCDSSIPAVTILSPNGGETYFDRTINVTWKTQNVPPTFTFDVIRLRGYPNGQEYSLFANDILNDGQETITIPSNIPDGSYTLEIKAYLNNVLVMDSSDSYFKIVSTQQPSITIIYPTAGTTLIKGLTYNFQTSGVLDIYNAVIKIANSSGTTVKTINAGVVSRNSNFNWTIPTDWADGVYTISAISGGSVVNIVNNSFSITSGTNSNQTIVNVSTPLSYATQTVLANTPDQLLATYNVTVTGSPITVNGMAIGSTFACGAVGTPCPTIANASLYLNGVLVSGPTTNMVYPGFTGVMNFPVGTSTLIVKGQLSLSGSTSSYLGMTTNVDPISWKVNSTNGQYVKIQNTNIVVSNQITINISNTNQTPVQPTVSLIANPTTISYTGTTTLTWSTTNATNCSFGDLWGSKSAPLSGSNTVSGLTQTTTYTLSCVNAAGVGAYNSASVTITVNPQSSQPTINSILPTTGPAGTIATVTGTNLNGATFLWASTEGAGAGGPQSFQSVSGDGTRATFMFQNGFNGIMVGKSVLYFTVTSSVIQPIIISISPTSVPVETSGTATIIVTINGSGFQSSNVVYFGDSYGMQIIPPTSVSANGTSMTFVMPISNLVQTENIGVCSTSNCRGTISNLVPITFTSTAPTVTSVFSSPVEIGTTISIYGSGFTGKIVIYSLGSTEGGWGPNSVSADGKIMTFTVPSLPSGYNTLVIENANGKTTFTLNITPATVGMKPISNWIGSLLQSLFGK